MNQTRLTRSAKVTIEIADGAEALAKGHETARCLWNFVRYCVRLYSRQYRQKFTWLALGKLPWPGKYGLDKAFRDHYLGKQLADRCYSTTIKEFDIAYRGFMTKRARGDKEVRRPRYCEKGRPLYFEVGRNAKPLGAWTYRLTVLGGHIPNRHAVVKLRIGPGIKMKDIKAIRLQPDGSGTVIVYKQARPSPGDRIAAVDLGINNLAVIAFDSGESILYPGGGLLSSDQWYQKRAAKCKPSGWKKGRKLSKPSKRLVQYRVKAGNIRRLAVHNLTRSLIDECVRRKVGTLAIGDLTHIRKDKDFGKRGNVKLHAWPFAEIRRQLEYKGEEAGIEIIAVSERNTSRGCCGCGVINKSNRIHRGLYRCKDCGLVINADLNGAINILAKVSPGVEALGVEAIFPGLPSPAEVTPRIGEVPQIVPTFVAKFDLRNWSIAIQGGCTRAGSMQTATYQQ